MEAGQPERLIFHGHPSWRSMLGFHAGGFILAVAAGALAGIISALAAGHVLAGWVVLAVLAGFVLVLARGLYRRRATTYTITDRRLTIETGLLGRQVHETRLEQIQNVSSTQSLLDRLLGVGDVSFDTAGSAGFDFSLRGVADPRQIARAVDQALPRRAWG